jgi:hypothetical protein
VTHVLLGNRKKIAKFLMRTFTCRSTFLYGYRDRETGVSKFSILCIGEIAPLVKLSIWFDQIARLS